MSKFLYIVVINLILSLQCFCLYDWGNLSLHNSGEDPPSTKKDDEYADVGEDERISAKMCSYYYDVECTSDYPSRFPYFEEMVILTRRFPFMALIGYDNPRTEEWKCAGSLISSTFVLSSAYCSTHYGRPLWVKLGELGFIPEDKDSRPQYFEIISIHNHPDYEYPQAYNNIALYELNRPAILNQVVRTVCLNQWPNLNSTERPIIGIGWKVRKSELLGVNKKLLNADRCNREEFHEQLPQGTDSNSIICAESRNHEIASCSGDSGGALVYKPRNAELDRGCFLFTLIGINSFGNQCGQEDHPELYTDVYYFLSWIESIVWP